MKLKEALKRAIKICPKAKDQGLFKSVRLIAGNDKHPTSVFTTDGLCMSLVPVDVTLPDALISGEGLSSAVKGSGDLELVIGSYGSDSVKLVGVGNSYSFPKSNDLSYFPNPPELPTTFKEVDWEAVKKVLHAAEKDKAGATLSVVNFSHDYVEAFDSIRLARVKVPCAYQGLVPLRLFKHWAKGPVSMAFTDHFAYFKVKGEIRIANLSGITYPDTTTLTVNKAEDGYVIIDLDQIISMVERATEISPLNLVMLELSGEILEIRACDIKGQLNAFRGVICPVIIYNNMDRVTVDGKLFLQALKQCDTPRVKLTSGDNVDPLRIDSGLFTEYLWQTYWENKE